MFAQVDHPGLGLLMDPTNYFETPQHRPHGRNPQPGVRHPERQDHASPTPRTSSAPTATSPRNTPTSAIPTRWRATRFAASARSSCRPRAWARSTTISICSGWPEAPEHPGHHRASRRERRPAREDVPRRQAARQRASDGWSNLRRKLTKREVDARAGLLAQFAGVRLLTLADGVERGVRLLEFRTGGGLRFTVLIDRAFDIGECEFKRPGDRLAIADRLPPPRPDRLRERGRALLRAFVLGPARHLRARSICGPYEAPADNYNYPGRKTIKHSLHGRLTTLPAQLKATARPGAATSACCGRKGSCANRRCSPRICTSTAASRPTSAAAKSASGIALSTTASGRRRTCSSITSTSAIPCWTRARAISRRSRTSCSPRMRDRYRAQGVGYRRMAAPSDDFVEQVWQHELAADGPARLRRAGQRPAATRLRGDDAQGPIAVSVRMAGFPVRPLCAGHRAFDAPRARRAVRARAQRDDLA